MFRWILAGWLAAVGLQAAEIHDAAKRGDLARVQELIGNDRTLAGAQDASGNLNTPLGVAAQNGRLEVVRYLLSQRADPNTRDRSGSAPLYHAAAGGHLEIVRALLDRKADVNLADEGGNTPLLMALMRGHAELSRLLIERGANVRVRTTHQGITVLHAGSAGAFRQDPGLIKLLIAKGADVNVRGRRGEAALHWAAGGGHIPTIKLLIEGGADLNPYDSAGGTPLHGAFQQNKQEAARLLIESGARLTEKDPYGYTALHLAAIRGYADLANVLLQRGADPHAGDRYGRTALYYATRHGRRAVAEALIAAGAKQDPAMERNFGKPPQLDARLAGGEAFLWFLGFFAHDGYAVKTGRHLLLFDPPGIDESPEASLANGHLNPKELEGQNITVFITKPDWERFDPAVLDLVNRLKNVNVVMAYKPEGRAGGRTIPPYRLAEPGQTFSIGDLTVRTIRATLGGVGYLVDADGLKIFHAGYHVRNTPAQDESYRKEIDSLSAAAPIDIALLPAAGHAIEAYTYDAYTYLLNRLSPRAVYLMHGVYGRENYWECATKLQKQGARVEFPENEGDRFHYQRPQTNSAPAPRAAERGALHSSALGEDREFSVWLPHDYATSQARYPVLFLLDGPRHFEYATGMVEYLSRYSEAIPPVIVVDISQQHRSRDMTPTPDKDRPNDTGGADKFLAFLANELVPHIQTRYRTQGPLVLSGYSLSGLFAIHALLTKPDLFDGYIAASPSLWWDNSLLVRRAGEFFQGREKLDRKLFFAVGKEERQVVQDYFDEMNRILEKNARPGFQATLRRLDGEGHPTICIPTMYYGLRAVFGQ